MIHLLKGMDILTQFLEKPYALFFKRESFLRKRQFLSEAAVLTVLNRVEAISELMLAFMKRLLTFWAVDEHTPIKEAGLLRFYNLPLVRTFPFGKT